MTATDQAFIRAYQHPPTEAAGVPTPHVPMPNSDQAKQGQPLWGTVDEYANAYWDAATGIESPTIADGNGYSKNDGEPDQTHHRIDTRELDSQEIGAQLTEPHIATPQIPVQVASADHVQSTHGQSTGKPTLSSALASRHQQSSPQASETTVGSFRLPRVCQQLLSQHDTAYQPLVSRLLANVEEGRTMFGMASCSPGVGCTTNLLCLAAQLTAAGKSVVLVDANFSKPKLFKLLGLTPTTTWQDVLNNGAPIAEALISSATDRITVLPATQPINDELSETAKLQASVTAGALRYEFDITLVDLGNVLVSGHPSTNIGLIQAMRLDAGLLVVDPTNSDLQLQNQAEQLFAKRGCEVLGTIENFVA